MINRHGIPIPENDWQALNVWKDEIEKHIAFIKSNAVNADGSTLSETLPNTPSMPKDTPNPPVPPPNPNPPPPPGPPVPPNPNPVPAPVINSFSIDPTGANAFPRRTQRCKSTKVVLSWDVTGARMPMKLKRTGIVTGLALVINLTTLTGNRTFQLGEQTSFLLTATNASGAATSPELTFLVSDPNPVPPPSPQPLLPPANVVVTVIQKFLKWAWDRVTNTDFDHYEFYASKTSGFSPDVNPPTDMVFYHGATNHTFFNASNNKEIWYGVVRQVNKAGQKSSLTAQVSNTSDSSDLLKAYHEPWKMVGLSIVRKVHSGNGTDTWSVPSGKIWMITGYQLKGTAGGDNSNFFVNGYSWDSSLGNVTINRNPQYTSGLFISYRAGDQISLSGNSATCSSWIRIKEFNEDYPDINTRFLDQNQVTPYTVPTGKNFVMTYAVAGYPTPTLQESTDSGATWNDVLPSVASDFIMFSVSQEGGVIIFPAGTKLRSSIDANHIRVFGYEISAP